MKKERVYLGSDFQEIISKPENCHCAVKREGGHYFLELEVPDDAELQENLVFHVKLKNGNIAVIVYPKKSSQLNLLDNKS